MDSLMNNSLDMIKNASSLMNTSDAYVQQSKHEDRYDSDDYADSDN